MFIRVYSHDGIIEYYPRLSGEYIARMPDWTLRVYSSTFISDVLRYCDAHGIEWRLMKG